MLIASAVGVTLCVLAVVFVLGFVVGASIGLVTGEVYRSERECRECMRRIVTHGFRSDGKNYSAVEDGR